MPRYSLDTSALVKRNHAEAGSATVDRILAEPNSEFFIARLAAVEILSAFAGKVRLGELPAHEYDRLRRRFLADVRKRSLRPLRMLNAHYQHAGDLIGKQATSRPLRTLNALQLAAALHLHQAAPIDRFVCADRRLSEVARIEGLVVEVV